MRRLRRKRMDLSEEGQSTIEFALTMLLMMGFVLFFIQLSLIFAYGNLVHYATFMSARAYLAAGPEQDDQETRARDVLIALLKKSVAQPGIEKYPFIAKAVGGTNLVPGMTLGAISPYAPKESDYSWLQGVRYEFRGSVSLIPVGTGKNGENFINLVSESFLGREPSYDDCAGFMGDLPNGGAIFDNGC